MSRACGRRGQQGFLVIAAVFLIVVLAALVGYLMTVSTTSQVASVADLNSARAYQAARAGNEWGIWRILLGPGGMTDFEKQCETAEAVRNLTFVSTLASFKATVTCNSTSVTEGAASVRTYTLVSNACNVSTGGAKFCPNAASTASTYAERELRLTVTR